MYTASSEQFTSCVSNMYGPDVMVQGLLFLVPVQNVYLAFLLYLLLFVTVKDTPFGVILILAGWSFVSALRVVVYFVWSYSGVIVAIFSVAI